MPLWYAFVLWFRSKWDFSPTKARRGQEVPEDLLTEIEDSWANFPSGYQD